MDVKVRNDTLVVAVDRLVRKYARERLTLWGSFLSDVNAKLHSVNPNVPLFMSLPRALQCFLAWKCYSLDKLQIHEAAIILPWQVRPYGWVISFLNKEWFEALNAKGVCVVAYGNINGFKAFEACRKHGVNAICTDSPSLLQSYLQNHQLAPLPWHK